MQGVGENLKTNHVDLANITQKVPWMLSSQPWLCFFNLLEINNKIKIKALILPQDWCLQIAAYQVTSATALLCHAADSTRCSADGQEQPLEAQLM